MRAKVRVLQVAKLVNEHGTIQSEQIKFTAVGAKTYTIDGKDEDNTYALYTPTAEFNITVNNPALWNTFLPGKKYYVDFTEVSE